MTSIACPLSLNSRRHSTHWALIDGKRRLNYSQLNAAVERTRRNLLAQGIKAGERVALLTDKTAEAIVLLLALWRNRTVSVLPNRYLSAPALARQLKKVGTSKRIQRADVRSLVDLNITTIPEIKPFRYAAEADLAIVFTSGTSQAPKPALLSFANLYYNAKGANEHIPVNASATWLLSLPIYHVGGLGIIFRCLLGGAAIFVSRSNSSIEKDIQQERITHISLVPTQLHQLLANKKNILALKKMKCILLGGAPMPKALLKRALALNLPLYASYGCTEMASQIATTNVIRKNTKHPLSASILPYRRVRLSKSGEILVKGRTLFKGYQRSNALDTGRGKDGWFPTGDLGQLTEKGELIVLGRKDNLMISGGENIQPEEIEGHLSSLGLGRSCVIARKDRLFGERPVAFIESSGKRKISLINVRKRLLKRAEKFKVPDEWYYWPQELSQSPLKTPRHELQQFYLNHKNKLRPIN